MDKIKMGGSVTRITTSFLFTLNNIFHETPNVKIMKLNNLRKRLFLFKAGIFILHI